MSPGSRRNLRSRASFWLCVLSALFIVYGTTIPFRFAPDRRLIRANWQRLTFNPFFPTATGRPVHLADAAQNILLFLPFGVFGAAALTQVATPHRRVLLVVAAGAALSASVEGLQLIEPYRSASVADLFFNVWGAAIGAVVSPAVMDAAARLAGRLKRHGVLDGPMSFPLIVGVVLVCLAAWEPFDVTLNVDVWQFKLRVLGNDLWQPDRPASVPFEAFRLLMLTMLAASWLRSLGVRACAASATAACALLAVCLEASQMLITSRLPGLTDLAINLAGAASGGLLFAWVGPTAPSIWFFPLAGITALAALMTAHNPTRYAAFWQASLVPGRAYWAVVVNRVSELLLMYFPLGFALPWVIRRPSRARLSAVAVGMGCAASIAGLQRWTGAAYPTVATVMIATLASVAGASVALAGRGVSTPETDSARGASGGLSGLRGTTLRRKWR